MSKQEVVHKLEGMSLVQKLGIMFALVILLAGGFWYVLLRPYLEKAVALHKEIAKIESDMTTFQKKNLALPGLIQKVEARQAEWVAAQTLLPKDAQALERLLASFEMLAQEVGVGFVSFTPGQESVAEFYASRGVNLRIRGTFHGLMLFFDKLSKLDRLVELDSLRLQPAGQLTRDAQALLTADSQLIVFRALTDAEREAQKARKTKKPKQ